MGFYLGLDTDRCEYGAGEEIEATLSLVNGNDVKDEIFFSDGQRYDFVIERELEKGEVWRWSKDRAFTMAIGKVILDPGEEKRYSETLEAEYISPGAYELVGIITGKPRLRTSSSITIKEDSDIFA